MNTQYDSRTADKFVVRLPDGLRNEVQGAADHLDTSMNTVFIQAIRQYLDTQQRQQLLLDALAKAVTGKEELDAVLLWRGKHTQAIRERDAAIERIGQAEEMRDRHQQAATLAMETSDRVIAERNALQLRLTAADERNDEVIDLLRRARAVIEGGGWADLERDIAKFFKPAEGDGKPCACPGCDSPRRANSPFCVAHRSVKSRTRGQDPLTADGLEWLMQNDGHQQ